ncbi:MAG: alpha/beta hydrolase [Parvibaculaceae bacterium]|nr:alpha/beta hydrolase [Parvibaculaceae bacterium]
MSLDPEIQVLIDGMAEAGGPPLHEMAPEDARALYAAMSQMLDTVDAPIGQVEDRTVGEGVPVRIYSPVAGSGVLPVLVFFHGGGWVIGDLNTHDSLCRSLANQAHCRVVAVDYRLSPEHKFPAALDDAYGVLKWVEQYAAEIDVDPNRIAVAGDSAGGNLAAVLALKARDEKGPSIALQLLIYPVTDLTAEDGSREDFSEGYFLAQETMLWFSDQYMGPDDDWQTPYASPLMADDFSGLPPAYVVTAGYDILRDEGKAYADALSAAGVSVTYENYEGMIHGFFNMQSVSKVSVQAVTAAAVALEAAFSA